MCVAHPCPGVLQHPCIVVIEMGLICLVVLIAHCLLQGDAVENFWDIPRDRLEKTFMVNIVGMISLAQKAVQHMPSGGSIINVRPISFCCRCCQPVLLWLSLASIVQLSFSKVFQQCKMFFGLAGCFHHGLPAYSCHPGLCLHKGMRLLRLALSYEADVL